jgi:hypothetical protein
VTDAPCGRADCPVPPPSHDALRRLRTTVLPAGGTVHRGFRFGHDPEELAPGTGNTRFAPLPDTSHAYVSTATRTTALLESALHELSGPEPRIYRVQLRRWGLAPMRLTHDLRLADLRDDELVRLGLGRSQLVTTAPLHYPCVRRWAVAIQPRRPGGYPLAGIVWHSRQADVHAAEHADGLLGDLLVHRSVEVAVVWSPPGPKRPFAHTGEPEPRLVDAAARTRRHAHPAPLQAPIL